MTWYRNIFNLLKKYKWYAILFFLFVLSFNFNIFGLGQTEGWFGSFQQDSGAIIEKTAECTGAIPHYSGPLVAENRYERGCNPGDFKPYGSQFGLQARLTSEFAGMFSNFQRGLKTVELLLTLTFASILTLLVWKFRNQFGSTVATVTAIGLLLSPWLASFSYNLYWVVFTIFLPFIFSLCTYEIFKKSKRMWAFYSVLLLLFLLKFLSGYEYASTMVFSAFIPVAFFELKKTGLKPLLALWKQAVLIACAGFIALVLAITANTAALKGYAGSWGEAFQIVGGRAEARSNAKLYQAYVIRSMHRTAPAIYDSIDRLYDLDKFRAGDGASIKYVTLSAVNYMMLPAVSLPFVMKEPFGTIVQSIFAIGIVALAALWRLKKKKYQLSVLCKLSILYWLGLVGALSWLILMPGHGYVHLHINAIIFYIPFLIACYGIIGQYIQYTVRGLKVKKRAKRG